MTLEMLQLHPGDNFGGFCIVSELGRGNNGVVYLARQELLNREVALKVLLPELSRDDSFVDMLMNEARNAASLCHPNIVQAMDAGYDRGTHYLAMEYVNGRTLEDIRLNTPEELSLKFLVEIFIQLADALEYSWKNFSMTHGDIKPENMLINNRNKELKLADLGLAHISGRIDSEDGSIMATPMYISPELASGSGTAGVCSDIYSFGIMFYELIAGKPPFRGDTEHLLYCHAEVTPPPLTRENPDAPRELAEFIHKMIEKDPKKRPSSWQEVKEFLTGFHAINYAPNPKPESPVKRKKIKWGVISVVLGAILLILLTGALITFAVLTSAQR